MLVEVKTRSKLIITTDMEETDALKEFWKDAILVVVIPEGNCFYFLNPNGLDFPHFVYDLDEFKKIQNIFRKVQSDTVSHFKKWVLKLFR